jgi:hypothetical protein
MAATVNEFNTVLEVEKSDGSINRHFPVTKIQNVLGLSDITSKQQSALVLLAANSYVIDDTTGETYKIGCSNGKFYYTKSEVSIKEILDTITAAIEAASEASKV